ncbi:hypothetical protein VP01_8923g1 [Puccinia sorghi]|uniref:Uncharacterized protein n=1 Tax=Puccinia sorghi TaxID=27349 RepID=A0A0L6U845_9BASI|nr:hypothetical protein VP01_8923g1 [Puccinia sorghi]
MINLRKQIIAIVNFYPISTMDPSLKSQYQCLSQHLIATSQMALDMLGRQKGHEEASKTGITGIAAKVAKDPNGYCELQSHIGTQIQQRSWRFYLPFILHYLKLCQKKTHKDNDASPFTFFMCIPVEMRFLYTMKNNNNLFKMLINSKAMKICVIDC